MSVSAGVIRVGRTKEHTVYRTADGKRVPGVTTICGVWSSPGELRNLMEWAARMVREGEDPTRRRDQAASVGTLAHAFVTADLVGCEVDTSEWTPEEVQAARAGYAHYLDWRRGRTVDPVLVEGADPESIRIGEPTTGIVSERLRIGGTPDLLAYIDGELALIDFKSGGVWPKAKVQLAGYHVILEELGFQAQRFEIVQISHDPKWQGGTTVIADISPWMNVFMACHALYDAQRAIR